MSLAIQYGNELTVVSIIESDQHNVAVNAVNKIDGSTALIRACELNQTEIAIKLISFGANVKPQTMVNIYSQLCCMCVKLYYTVEWLYSNIPCSTSKQY